MLEQLPWPPLLILNSGHRVSWINFAASKALGVPKDESVGLDFSSLFHPSHRDTILASLRAHPSGHLDAVPLSTPRQTLVSMAWASAEKETLVALWEIERIHELESALRQAKDRAEKITEMGDMGIVVYDQDFRIEFANEVACDILGCSQKTIIGSQITTFLGHLERIQLKHLHASSISEPRQKVRMELPIQRADGTSKLVEMFLAMTTDFLGRPRTYAYLRDLTERVKMENELRKTNEFLQNVIRSSVDGIIAADMKGNIIIFNEGAERLLGYKAQEVIGKIHITQLYPPGVAKKIMRQLRSDTYGPRGKLPTTPTTLVAKNGEYIPVRISAAIIYEGEKEIASVGIFRDLRERIKMQQQLEDTYRQLLHSEKLASLGKLAAGVAHELNNPLGGILMYANMLLEQIPDGPMAKDLREIADQAMRCKEIVRGLLDFARRRGEGSLKVNVNEVLEKSLSLLSRQAMFLNVTLEKDLQPNLPLILADPDQLGQVFTNLIVNAIDAMEGKGTLRLKTWAEGAPTYVHVEVSDTGHGIPEEDLGRIFDPFFTTKEIGRGTGLGLSIAYGIVKRQGGDIQVSTRLGEGTTFHLKFPQEPPPDARGEPEHGVTQLLDAEGRSIQVVLGGERTLPKLLTFYDSFEPKGAFGGLPPEDRKERRNWIMGLMGGWRNFLLLEGENLVGHIGVTMGEGDLEEVIILIHQDYRGKGIGTQALRHVSRLLAKEGYKRLWLTVESTNIMAIRCFRKVGFQLTSPQSKAQVEMILELER